MALTFELKYKYNFQIAVVLDTFGTLAELEASMFERLIDMPNIKVGRSTNRNLFVTWGPEDCHRMFVGVTRS